MSTYVKNYADDHKAYIFFSDDTSTVKLPAFLSAFSIDMSIDREKISKLTNDYTVYRDKGVSYTYNFTIDIPFYNRQEAIDGHSKIQTLQNMIRPNSGRRTEEYISKGIKILFRNLINNGTGISSVATHGVSVVLDSINVEYNTDFGFFDGKKTFYSKLYTISFSAKVIVSKAGKKDVCLGYNSDGSYHMDDTKWWPFQFDKETYNYRSPNTYESQYISSHNAIMTFRHVSKKRSVTLNAFIDNFSKSNSYEFQKHNLGADLFSPKEIKEISYKFLVHFPANNRKQAKQNMIMAQNLFRIFAPPKISAGHSYATSMSFANLVKNESVYVNSVSLKIDTNMGFFDQNKRYYIKYFSVDFTAEKGIKSEEAEISETSEESGGSSVEESPSSTSTSDNKRTNAQRKEDYKKTKQKKVSRIRIQR